MADDMDVTFVRCDIVQRKAIAEECWKVKPSRFLLHAVDGALSDSGKTELYLVDTHSGRQRRLRFWPKTLLKRD